MREIRQNFLTKMSETQALFPGTIFSERQTQDELGRRHNYIKVVMSLDWPTERGKPIPISQGRENRKIHAILANIFRVKGFIETQLMEEIETLDIRPGCIAVRFTIGPSITSSDVADALTKLNQVALNYDITSLAAHVDGQAVKF